MFITKMNTFKILLLCTTIQAALSSCNDCYDPNEDCVHRSVTNGIRSLTINLLKGFAKVVALENNLIFSGCNIYQALAAIDLAAYGETENQIVKVMDPRPERKYSKHHKHDAIMEFQEGVQNTIKEIVIRIATGVFIQKNKKINEQYAFDLNWYYNGSAQSADFEKKPNDVVQQINKFVANKTFGLIPKFLSNPLPTDTKVFLVSTLYFKAPWMYPFAKECTKKRTFKTEKGRKVEANMMSAEHTIPYLLYCPRNMQVIGIPYADGETYMYILLPLEGHSIREIIDNIDSNEICKIINATQPTNVHYRIPRFENNWSKSIDPQLKALGIQKAYTDNAEFDMIEGCETLKVSTIFHAAKIITNEKGTEAAAATGVVMVPTSIPTEREIFIADRAFIYIIFNKKNNAILFGGFVNNPENK